MTELQALMDALSRGEAPPEAVQLAWLSLEARRVAAIELHTDFQVKHMQTVEALAERQTKALEAIVLLLDRMLQHD